MTSVETERRAGRAQPRREPVARAERIQIAMFAGLVAIFAAMLAAGALGFTAISGQLLDMQQQIGGLSERIIRIEERITSVEGPRRRANHQCRRADHPRRRANHQCRRADHPHRRANHPCRRANHQCRNAPPDAPRPTVGRPARGGPLSPQRVSPTEKNRENGWERRPLAGTARRRRAEARIADREESRERLGTPASGRHARRRRAQPRIAARKKRGDGWERRTSGRNARPAGPLPCRDNSLI